MALSDYRLCDICGGKAFYDSNLNYESQDDPDFEGEPLPTANGKRQWFHLDNLGSWAVICKSCRAKGYECMVVQAQPTTEDGD